MDKIKQTHLVFDFDRTLTVSKDGVSPASTTFSLFREQGVLGEEYDTESKRLFAKYRPVEIATDMDERERFHQMDIWWAAHLDLLVASNLTKEIIKKVVTNGNMKLRSGSKEIFEICNEKNIPIVILSAGLGDVIKEFLQQEGIDFANVKTVANWFEFEVGGKVIGYKKPYIHTLNKDEDHIPEEVKILLQTRPNIILFGDTVSDLKMIPKGFTGNVLKFGFTNGHKDLEESFAEHFNFVLKEKDSGMEDVLKILKQYTC